MKLLSPECGACQLTDSRYSRTEADRTEHTGAPEGREKPGDSEGFWVSPLVLVLDSLLSRATLSWDVGERYRVPVYYFLQRHAHSDSLNFQEKNI